MYKFFLYLLLIQIATYAQSIDFEFALDETLKNNKKLQAKKLDIKSAELDIKNVQAISYGKLEFTHEMSRTNHSGHVFNSKLSSREATFRDFGFSQMAEGIDTQPQDLNYPDSRNNYNTKVSYEIPLFTGFKLSTQEEMLKIKNSAEKIKLNLDKKALELEVLKAYNGAVVAKEFIKASLKAKEVSNLFVNSALEFYKEGLVTKIDTKQAKVHALNVQSKVTEAKNRFDIAIAYLRFLTSNDIIEDVNKIRSFKIENINFEELYKTALINRDDLKLSKKYTESMKKNIDLKNSSFYPNVYSYLEYGVNDDTITFDSEKDYYMAMLGVKYTLFDQTRSIKKEKSQIEFNKTTLNQKQLEDAIKLEVQKVSLNLNAKNKIYEEKKEAMNLAFEVLEQSKLMYKNQLISMTELLKQEAIYRENEANFIMAKYEKSLAEAKLLLTIGKSLRG